MSKDKRGYSDLEYMTYGLVQRIIMIIDEFLLDKPGCFLKTNKHLEINPLSCRTISGMVLSVAKSGRRPSGVCTILGGCELWTGSSSHFEKILPGILELFGADEYDPMHVDGHFLYYAIKKIGHKEFDNVELDNAAFCYDLKECQDKWKKINRSWNRANRRK